MNDLQATGSLHLIKLANPLPALQQSIRYYDDFLDVYHTIGDLNGSDVWVLKTDGAQTRLDFTIFPKSARVLFKLLFSDFFQRYDTTSIRIFYNHLTDDFVPIALNFVSKALSLKSHDLQDYWMIAIRPTTSTARIVLLRAILQSIGNLRLGQWDHSLASFVSALPAPKQDSYKAVRTGECFIPLDQQAKVIVHFDELSSGVSTDYPGYKDLRDICLLLVMFQYAFRPGQLARIKTGDIRVFDTGAVHFSTILTKQRDDNKRRIVNRSVKREWCPIFIEYRRRRALISDLGEGVPRNSLFGLTPASISISIPQLMKNITGVAWSATDLRHSAAQRLADAGASHVVLSEFMGHSDIRTANVYFDASPTQAHRVNSALGLSPIYSAVAEIYRTKTIDKRALAGLSEDHQIAGVPHGVPIAGIGRCELGQSLCTKNPVLSCYSCRKFLPVNDADTHRQVTDGLRLVVQEFVAAARGDSSMPAYTQLRRTLEAAERVISDIESAEGVDSE